MNEYEHGKCGVLRQFHPFAKGSRQDALGNLTNLRWDRKRHFQVAFSAFLPSAQMPSSSNLHYFWPLKTPHKCQGNFV